ncbi:unnamed protein product [Lymnaea stagnalis]|uniref:Glutathione peroxidase n=2 Tax=Lymnaea stagnalis TaxID=6523 RepID=A0AAV2HKJ8_LYMST
MAMHVILKMALLSFLAVHVDSGRYYSICEPEPDTSILEYTVTDIHGKINKTVSSLTSGTYSLVINVASFCRLTLQYYELNEMLTDFPSDQFSVLAFPSDQFGHQEPGVNGTEILNCLRHVRPGNGFTPNPSLNLMLRGAVNGENEIPLYTYLKKSCPQPSLAKFKPRESFWDPIRVSDVTWNFEKILVSPEGRPLYRFSPQVGPLQIAPLINALRGSEQQAEQSENIAAILEQLETNTDKEIKLRHRG